MLHSISTPSVKNDANSCPVCHLETGPLGELESAVPAACAFCAGGMEGCGSSAILSIPQWHVWQALCQSLKVRLMHSKNLQELIADKCS